MSWHREDDDEAVVTLKRQQIKNNSTDHKSKNGKEGRLQLPPKEEGQRKRFFMKYINFIPLNRLKINLVLSPENRYNK